MAEIMEETQLCTKIESQMSEGYKSQAFAVSSAWITNFRSYARNIKDLYDNAIYQKTSMKEVQQMFRTIQDIERPGPIQNFDLVFMSPEYKQVKEQLMAQNDFKRDTSAMKVNLFNDWSSM